MTVPAALLSLAWFRELRLLAQQAEDGLVRVATDLTDLDRDIYAETVEALGYDPLGAVAS